VRKRDLVPKDARVVGAPLLLTAALATWAAIAVSEKLWLYALVIAAVGVADLPLVARVRLRRGTTVALTDTRRGPRRRVVRRVRRVGALRPLGVIDATQE